ncbi:MAG TPA: serine/threonine-protein kinase [Ktedonobacteraceae bacterium]|nr:serine/threonine-protein kinase [Ktedonobacteraceae bacterium]
MSDEDYIGQQFGSYIIIELINSGGFGSVFKARHVHFENDPIVAIKILHSHISSKDEHAQFITEAKLLRKFKHPHMLPVMDVNIQNGIPYMITEYAVGGTLRNRINKQAGQPFPIVEAIRIITQVGEALQYAHQHEQHVVHCDLKPENILFNATGDALLADFGIAVILGTTGTKLLSKGGTLGYMAPEQFKGLVSPKIDQYALGCIAYELFAGRHPYNLQGANALVAEYQHSQVEPVAPSTYNPQLPAHVEIAIRVAMAKDRNNRYSNIADFLAALQNMALSQSAIQPITQQASTVPVTLRPPVGNHSNNLSQTSPDPIEQLFQEGVRAKASGNIEEAFRIWQQVITQDITGKYSTAAQNRIQELRPKMIPLRLKQARKASMQGHWQDEIRLWKDLLALAPSDQDLAPLLERRPLMLGTYSNSPQSIQQRLQIAQQNEQFTWMYIDAQNLIQNNDITTARAQLKNLWSDVPYYGDPANLGQIVGLPTSMNYEHAIATEQVRLEQEREQERLAQLKQKQEIDKQRRNNIILIIVIGGIVLLGAGTGGVGVEVWKVAIGDAGAVIAGGLMASAVIAGILAGIVLGVKEARQVGVAETGSVVVAVLAGIGGGGVADALGAGLAAGIIEGLLYGIVSIVLFIVVYRIVGALVGVVVEAIREKS